MPVVPQRQRNHKGLAGLITDDILCTGTDGFLHAEPLDNAPVGIKLTSSPPFRYLGQDTAERPSAPQGYTLSIKGLIDRLASLPTHPMPSFSNFREARCSPIYIAQTAPPEIAHRAAKLSQVTEQSLSHEHITQLNDLVAFLKKTKDTYLLFLKL